MRSVVIAVVLLVAVAAVANGKVLGSARYNGQDIYAEPNCAIVSDHSRMFRDISDPTHYWVCPEGQEKADYLQCPTDHAFMEKEQTCVLWSEWTWVEPYTK